jgi:hypothetical protein
MLVAIIGASAKVKEEKKHSERILAGQYKGVLGGRTKNWRKTGCPCVKKRDKFYDGGNPFTNFVETPGGNKATRNYIAEVATISKTTWCCSGMRWEPIRGRRGDTEKDSPRKLHVAGGILQKRLALSSPPTPSLNGPISHSSAPSTAGEFRFPVIFSNDPPSKRAKEGDNFLVIDAYGPDDMENGDGRRRMSACKKLPMSTRLFCLLNLERQLWEPRGIWTTVDIRVDPGRRWLLVTKAEEGKEGEEDDFAE